MTLLLLSKWHAGLSQPNLASCPTCFRTDSGDIYDTPHPTRLLEPSGCCCFCGCGCDFKPAAQTAALLNLIQRLCIANSWHKYCANLSRCFWAAQDNIPCNTIIIYPTELPEFQFWAVCCPHKWTRFQQFWDRHLNVTSRFLGIIGSLGM